MGLALYLVDAIIREHVHRPIAGDVLLVGRQTVYTTPAEAIGLLGAHGLEPAIDPKEVALDRDTRNQRSGIPPRDLISDLSLFALLGNRKVKALDHSEYEGAEIVHDLTTEVPAQLKGCADFIVDGSTLDNTFNPALTLKNYADLLRPGGRLIAVNGFSNHHEPYVMPSPAWYLDYFVMNRFADCKVYVVVHMPQGPNVFCVDPQCLLDPNRKFENFNAPFELAVVVIAEKGPHSTSAVSPTQAQYRPPQESEKYQTNFAEILRSDRPHVMRSWGGEMAFYPQVSGYLFIDRRYTPLDPWLEEQRQRLLAEQREVEQREIEAQRRFEHSLAGRPLWVVKRVARTAGYNLVETPVLDRPKRRAELASWVPPTIGARLKRRLLRLLQTTGYDLAKRPGDDRPKPRGRSEEAHSPIKNQGSP